MRCVALLTFVVGLWIVGGAAGQEQAAEPVPCQNSQEQVPAVEVAPPSDEQKQAAGEAIQSGLTWLATQNTCVSCHNVQIGATGFHDHMARYAVVDQPANSLSVHDRWHALAGDCPAVTGPTAKVTYLGVALAPVPESLRMHLAAPRHVGLLVENVEPDSPAQAAGVARYDVLTQLDDQLLINVDQFSVLVRTYTPGQSVALSLVHQNQPLTLTALLGDRDMPLAVTDAGGHLYSTHALDAATGLLTTHAAFSDVTQELRVDPPPASEGQVPQISYLGVHTSTPPEALAGQLGLKPGTGLLIDSVDEGTAAAAAGLAQFDVLVRFDGQLLINADQFTTLVRSHAVGDEVSIVLYRGGQETMVTAKLGGRDDPQAAIRAIRSSFELARQNGGSGWGTDMNVLEVHPHHDLSYFLNTLTDESRSLGIEAEPADSPEATEPPPADPVDAAESAAAPDVDDATFLRRVYLDVAGIPPSLTEVSAFLADTTPDKRKRLISRLVTRPEVISRFNGLDTVQWSDGVETLILTARDTQPQRLVIQDGQGEVVFSGPVTTADERANLPAGTAEKLDSMTKTLGSESPFASAATPTETPGEAKLREVVASVQIDGLTLAQVVELLSSQTGAKLVVHQDALTRSGYDAERRATIALKDVRLSSALATVLAVLGEDGPKLGYTVHDEVILISTDRGR